MAPPNASGIVIYHNPRCGSSRRTLALIAEAGLEATVVEYLKTPPTAAMLSKLAKELGVPLSGLLRQKEKEYAALDLGRAGVGDDDILAALIRHPILLNRPIVVTPLGTRLCRPPELVLEILPRPKA